MSFNMDTHFQFPDPAPTKHDIVDGEAQAEEDLSNPSMEDGSVFLSLSLPENAEESNTDQEATELGQAHSHSSNTANNHNVSHCVTESATMSELQPLEELCDEISPIPIAPALKRQNSQRRLRIASEDHRLFLADLTADILPFIEECNREMSSEDTESLAPQKSGGATRTTPPSLLDKSFIGDSNQSSGDSEGKVNVDNTPCSSTTCQNNNSTAIASTSTAAAAAGNNNVVYDGTTRNFRKAYNTPSILRTPSLNSTSPEPTQLRRKRFHTLPKIKFTPATTQQNSDSALDLKLCIIA